MKAVLMSIFLAAGMLAGCSSPPESGFGDDAIDHDVPVNVKDPGPSPLIPGFDVNAGPGTFWEFYWIKTSRASSSSGTSSEMDWGRIRFTMTEPVTIGGIELYAVEREGDPGPIPRWDYLGFNEHQFLGSQSGYSATVLFDAMTGAWNGGGFFSGGSDRALSATWGFADNEIVSTGAYSVESRLDEGGCQYYSEVGTICDDESHSGSAAENYRSGIGPLAYTSKTSSSYSGGGFYSSHESATHVGLVDTSLESIDGWTPTGIPWEEGEDMPRPRGNPGAAAAEGKLYVVGGSTAYAEPGRGLSYRQHTDLQIYDPAINSWTAGAAYPSAYLQSGPPTAAVGTTVYVAGYAMERSGNPDLLAAYDTGSDTWTARTLDAPLRLYHSDAVGIGRYFIQIGGTTYHDEANYQDTHVLIYDTREDRWFEGYPLGKRLNTVIAVPLGLDVYVLSFNGDYMYNLTTGQWTSLGTSTTASAAAALNGEIHAFQQGRQVLIYAPSEGTWRFGPITAATTYGAQAVTIDNVAYIVGGTAKADPPEAYATGELFSYAPTLRP